MHFLRATCHSLSLFDATAITMNQEIMLQRDFPMLDIVYVGLLAVFGIVPLALITVGELLMGKSQ
jgi:hypothetical protein